VAGHEPHDVGRSGDLRRQSAEHLEAGIAHIADVRSQRDFRLSFGNGRLHHTAIWNEFELRLYLIGNAELLERCNGRNAGAALSRIYSNDGLRPEQHPFHRVRC
jgi:hypothetical protein